MVTWFCSSQSTSSSVSLSGQSLLMKRISPVGKGRVFNVDCNREGIPIPPVIPVFRFCSVISQGGTEFRNSHCAFFCGGCNLSYGQPMVENAVSPDFGCAHFQFSFAVFKETGAVKYFRARVFFPEPTGNPQGGFQSRRRSAGFIRFSRSGRRRAPGWGRFPDGQAACPWPESAC